MSQKISIYNLQDQYKNNFIVITNNCQCDENENIKSKNNKNVKNNISSILAVPIIKTSKNKNNNNEKEFNLSDSLDQNNKNNNKKITIFKKEYLKNTSNLHLTLDSVSKFYNDKNFNPKSSDVINLTDIDAILEDQKLLIYKPIFKTKSGHSSVGWVKSKNECGSPTVKIGIYLGSSQDIFELKDILSEVTSNKKPVQESNLIHVIINPEVYKPNNESEIIISLLIINMMISVACSMSRQSYGIDESNTQENNSPLVEVRGTLNLINDKIDIDKLNKNKNNQSSEDLELKEVMMLFYKDLNYPIKLIASAKKFKSDKNRLRALRVEKLINNKGVLNENNVLKKHFKPYVESCAIIRTLDPVSNNNKYAKEFNQLLDKVGYIKYSKYIDLQSEQDNIFDKNLESKRPIVTVSLNIKENQNNNYSNENQNLNLQKNNLENLDNKIYESKKDDKKNLENNYDKEVHTNEELMGSEEINFD